MQRALSSWVVGAPLSTLIAVGISSWSAPGLAQAPAPPPAASATPATQNLSENPREARLDPVSPGLNVVDEAEPLPPLVPRSKDLLGGHLLLAASVGPTWSLGRLSSQAVARHALGTGLGVQADAGFGVSRSVALGVWGSFARYADGSRCDSCAGQALAVGPFVRYQLVQGLRLDPWILAGAGYRQVSFDDDAGAKQTFSGITWLRLELGADYYVWSGLGFGPYAGLALSSYSKQPEGAGKARVNTELNLGLRFLFDAPGR